MRLTLRKQITTALVLFGLVPAIQAGEVDVGGDVLLARPAQRLLVIGVLMVTKEGTAGAEDAVKLFGRIAVDSGADRREADCFDIQLGCQLQARLIT